MSLWLPLPSDTGRLEVVQQLNQRMPRIARSLSLLSVTHIGEAAHVLTDMDAAADFAQPSGYRTMANSTSAVMPTGWSSYYYWNVLARRDTGAGYTGIAVAHNSGRAWIGYNIDGSLSPNWVELYSAASPQILIPNGSAAAPGLASQGDPDAGIFRSANNVLGFATNGTEWMTLDGAGLLTVGVRVRTASLDIGSGAGTPASGYGRLYVSGTELWFVDSAGTSTQIV